MVKATLLMLVFASITLANADPVITSITTSTDNSATLFTIWTNESNCVVRASQTNTDFDRMNIKVFNPIINGTIGKQHTAIFQSCNGSRSYYFTAKNITTGMTTPIPAMITLVNGRAS